MVEQSRPRVIVFNGGSSSGKSSLTRALQEMLPGAWLRFSVDTLVDACPPSLLTSEGLDLAHDGTVAVGPAFTTVETHWMAGLARMAELGAHLLIEDNFVSGPAAQHRWQSALSDIPTLWVGVRCDPDRAARREQHRGDRAAGMARLQAESVHIGIAYDLEITTTDVTPDEAAQQVTNRYFQ